MQNVSLKYDTGIKDLNVSKVNTEIIIHSDLVELAGFHAYMDYPIGKNFEVNGEKYKVVDVINTESGLDALTVKNLSNNEYVVVFQGSTEKHFYKDWWGTNAWLITDIVPEQLEDALDYFNKMIDEYDIKYVVGNSLGGADANYVGIMNPDVEVVTLNPALLPGGTIDPSKNYENITNYYSEYDFLTIFLETLGYGDRIPGIKAKIKHGVPVSGNFSGNHTGFIRDEDTGQTYFIVGKSGEPGHGRIFVDADDHVLTSIWRGYSLHTGYTEIIEINGPEI